VRLSVGIGAAEDLVADLAQALRGEGGASPHGERSSAASR
jgi:hypothetical protein